MKRWTRGHGALEFSGGEERLLERVAHLVAELQALRSGDRLVADAALPGLAEAFNRILTELEQAQADLTESQGHLHELLNAVPIGLLILDAETHLIVEANPVAIRLIGAPREEIIGQVCHRFVCPAEVDQCPITDRHEKLHTSERTLLTKDGDNLPIIKTVIPIQRQGKSLLLESFIDLSEIKRAEARLNYLSYHDALTGLPNRLLFCDRLDQALARARRHDEPVAIMLLDLDRFQEINDTLGHEVGDRLLQMAAKSLTKGIRESDTIAHLSGDEFFFILPDTDASGAERTASRLLQSFNTPFLINGQEIFITPSIGISLYPMDGDTPEILIKNADLAMYRAKAQGKNQHQFFTSAMSTAIFQRRTVENHLRKAIEHEDFRVYYQPQVEIETGRIVGMEALIRWQHPEKGMIMPNNFIPIAEETGLIVPIGEWVIRAACMQYQYWQAHGLPPIRLAINLAARQFQQLQHRNLIDTVFRVLDELQMPPQFLELEITESMAMQNIENTAQVLKKLSERGIRIAIDDFGTGYSSLSYLKKFPINSLKVDRSFIKDVTTDSDSAAIVTAIIAMAKNLRVKVIAEGVETAEQLEFLRRYECDEIQGYLFSRPVPPEDFIELLRK